MSNIYNMADTWTGGLAYTAILMNVTDTSSTAGSLLMDLQVASSSKFAIGKTGQILAANGTLPAPVYSFAAEAGTGLLFDGTNMTFSRQNSAKVTVISTGVSILDTIDMAGWFTIKGNTAQGIGFGSSHIINWASATTNAGTTGDLGIKRNAAGILEVNNGTPGTFAALKVSSITTNTAAAVVATGTTLTNGAGAGAGTITNAPSAGNPTKWIGINDNGTTRYVPAW